MEKEKTLETKQIHNSEKKLTIHKNIEDQFIKVNTGQDEKEQSLKLFQDF